MENEMENQLRKEREEFDQRRAELSTRAAQRRQQLHEDAAAGSLDDAASPQEPHEAATGETNVFTIDEDDNDGSRFSSTLVL
jgi:hypothetical protein